MHDEPIKSGYKRTEVGVIPEDWEIKSLGELGECIIGLTYRPDDVTADGLLVLRSSNIADGKLKYDDNVYVDAEVSQRLIVRKNDILICVRNGSRDLIGKCALIDERAEGMTFGAFMSIFRTEASQFVFYQFQSDLVEEQIHSHIGATINQITNKNLNSFQIPFPENDVERDTIAEALSDVDTLVEALDRLIAKKRAIKQGAMLALLTGRARLPGFERQPGYKRTEVGIIPDDWDLQPLGEIGTFSKGRGISKRDLVDDGLPCIRYGEIYTHHHDFVREFFSFITPEVAAESQRLHKGDLLFTGSGETAEEIGKCVAFLGEMEAYAGGDIVIFSPAEDNSMYLGYLMNHTSIVSQRIRMAQGHTVVHISAQHLAQLQLPLPKIPEQTAIAEVLSDMDAEIEAFEQRRAKLRAIKQGMMQELLTGRTRLVQPQKQVQEVNA